MPTHPTRLLGFAADNWALHPTTGLCTRLLGSHPTTGICTQLYWALRPTTLGFPPDYWTLHPTTGLCTRPLGLAPDNWALHPTTGLCTRLLGFAPDYWALNPTTRLSSERQDFVRNPIKPTRFRPTYKSNPFPIGIRVIINGILPYESVTSAYI